MTVLAVAVVVLWLIACVVWAVMSIPGGLMANASGFYAPARHMTMLAGLALGQLVVAAAGLPLGLSIAFAETRSSHLSTFAGLLAAGVVLQVGFVLWFFARDPR